jgi:hypothetical protein
MSSRELEQHDISGPALLTGEQRLATTRPGDASEPHVRGKLSHLLRRVPPAGSKIQTALVTTPEFPIIATRSPLASQAIAPFPTPVVSRCGGASGRDSDFHHRLRSAVSGFAAQTSPLASGINVGKTARRAVVTNGSMAPSAAHPPHISVARESGVDVVGRDRKSDRHTPPCECAYR